MIIKKLYVIFMADLMINFDDKDPEKIKEKLRKDYEVISESPLEKSVNNVPKNKMKQLLNKAYDFVETVYYKYIYKYYFKIRYKD